MYLSKPRRLIYMPLNKRFPWLSMSLLFAAYIIFGKFVVSLEHSIVAFAGAMIWGVLVAVLLKNPFKGVRRILVKWFKSDTVAFSSILMFAALASILLNWLKVFLPVFMILFAELLVRLDLQTAEFSQSQSLVILIAVAWSGLGIGWALAHVI